MTCHIPRLILPASSYWYFRPNTSIILVTRRLGLESRQRQVFFSSLLLPDRLWGPPSLLSNGCRRFLTRG